MKCVVLNPYIDKITKKEHKKGEIVDVTVARFNEITEKGKFIKLVDENEPKKA